MNSTDNDYMPIDESEERDEEVEEENSANPDPERYVQETLYKLLLGQFYPLNQHNQAHISPV